MTAGGGEERHKRCEKVGGSRRPVSRVLSVHSRANALANRTVIPLGVQSPERSSSLPAARCRETPWSRRTVSRRLFGLAPAGVYRAVIVADDAVGSYPTISPLPRHGCRQPHLGGLLSVALSVARSSRRVRPGVTWQPALWSPDFPRCTRSKSSASRPSGRRLPVMQYTDGVQRVHRILQGSHASICASRSWSHATPIPLNPVAVPVPCCPDDVPLPPVVPHPAVPRPCVLPQKRSPS